MKRPLLPKPLVKILVRDDKERKVSEMVYSGYDKPWRKCRFESLSDPVAWAPLPKLDDKRWRPYLNDTKQDEKVLCLGKYIDSPKPNIKIDSMHYQAFPGFMGSMPPMWGVSHWMPLDEAFSGEFEVPKSFLKTPVYTNDRAAVLAEREKERQRTKQLTSKYDRNIFWNEIPKNAKIYDLGSSYVVHMPDGSKGVAYWTGNDAGKAQAMLSMRALSKMH